MKIYMYSKDEAQKNNCPYVGNPVGLMLIFVATVVMILFVAIFACSWLAAYISIIAAIIPLIVFAIFTIIGFKIVLREIRLKTWSAHTAFIKDQDTLWAVRLTYIQFPATAITNNLVTTVLTAKPAIDSAKTNQRQKKELEERIVFPESYQEALIDAQGKAKIMKDAADKNFTFIFNGKESVIRLDDIKFIKETDKTEIYTYKNYKGKTTELEVIKAYPGLKEEVLNTKNVNHEYAFPKNYKEKISENPLYVFLILWISLVGIAIILYLLGLV